MTNSNPYQQPQPMQAQSAPKRKRKIRVFTWIILAINVLFVLWITFGVAAVAKNTCDPSLSQSACDGAKAIGGGIGTLLIIFLWVAADVILGIIWLVTRKREPQVVYVQQAPVRPYPPVN